MVLKSFIYAHSSFLNKNSLYKSVTIVLFSKSSNDCTHYSWNILDIFDKTQVHKDGILILLISQQPNFGSDKNKSSLRKVN